VQVDETCDGNRLSRTCADFGFSSGNLACLETCSGYDVTGCFGVPAWSVVEPDPCAACGPDQRCVDGACVPACLGAGPPDGAHLTFELRRSQVVGRLVSDGGFRLDLTDDLGFLIFVERDTGHEGITSVDRVDVGFGFATTLPEGTYSAFYFPPNRKPGLSDVPLKLASDLEVAGDATGLSLRFPPLWRLHGRLLLNGAPHRFDGSVLIRPSDDDAVHELWRLRRTEGAWIQRPDGTLEDFDVVLPEVRHDILYFGVDVIDLEGRFGYAPRFPLVQGLLLDGPERRDFDVQVSTLRGRVELDGAPPPQPLGWKALAIIPELDWVQSGQAVEPDPQGRFALRLYHGRYRLEWLGGQDVEEIDLRADTEIVLGSTTSPQVRLSGTLTFPGEFADDRGLAVRRAEAPFGIEAIFELVPDGPERWRFDGEIEPGSYAFTVVVPDASVPQGDGLREVEVGRADVESDTELALARPGWASPRVTGWLWVDGQPAPVVRAEPPFFAASSWGEIRLECQEGCLSDGFFSLEFGQPPAFDFPLPSPGVYRAVLDVRRTPDNLDLPLGSYVLDPEFEVRVGEQRRDFDVQLFEVRFDVDTGPGVLADLARGSDGPLRLRVARFEFPTTFLRPTGEHDVASTVLDRVDAPVATTTVALFPGRYRAYLSSVGLLASFDLGADANVRMRAPVKRLRGRVVVDPEAPNPAAPPASLRLVTPGSSGSTRIGADGRFDAHYVDFGPRLEARDETRQLYLLRDGCPER
jgi:hypothetical protein